MLSRICALTKVEIYKLTRQNIFYITLCLLLCVVVVSVLSEGASGSDKDPVNGFKPLIAGAVNGFRLSAFLILVIATLLYASETTYGTLKTILVAPFRRSELVIAKIIIVIIMGLLFTFIIESFSFGLSWLLYGFSDIIDPTFADIIHVSKSKMLVFTAYAFIHIFLPLIAIGLMGLLISTLVENAGIAVAIGIIVYLVLDFIVLGLFETVSSFLFNYYLNFYLITLRDISEGVLQEIWKFKVIGALFTTEQEDIILDGSRKMEVIKSFIIPLIYSFIFTVLAIITVSKRRN